MVFDNSNGDLEKHIHLQELINYDPLVNGGQTRWTDYCVMQMLGTRTDEADELLQRFPGIWLVAGGGQRGTKHPRDDKGHDSPKPPRLPPPRPPTPTPKVPSPPPTTPCGPRTRMGDATRSRTGPPKTAPLSVTLQTQPHLHRHHKQRP